MNTSEVQLRTVWTQGYWDGLDFIHMCIPRRSKAPYKQLKTKIMVLLKKKQLEKAIKWKSQQYRIKQNRRADAKNYTLSMASFF